MVGFARTEAELYDESGNITASKLSAVNERTVFRFFNIVDADKEAVKKAKAPVDLRNTLFHANPNKILDERGFNEELKNHLEALEEIIQAEIEFIEEVYKKIKGNLDKRVNFTRDDLELAFPAFSKYELVTLCENESDKLSTKIMDILN